MLLLAALPSCSLVFGRCRSQVVPRFVRRSAEVWICERLRSPTQPREAARPVARLGCGQARCEAAHHRVSAGAMHACSGSSTLIIHRCASRSDAANIRMGQSASGSNGGWLPPRVSRRAATSEGTQEPSKAKPCMRVMLIIPQKVPNHTKNAAGGVLYKPCSVEQTHVSK